MCTAPYLSDPPTRQPMTLSEIANYNTYSLWSSTDRIKKYNDPHVAW